MLRRLFKGRACGCLVMLVLSLMALLLTVGLAKSGLVYIPFFSDLFYRPPSPARQVIIDANETDVLAEELAATVDGRVGQITITESTLTLYLRQQTATGSDPLFAPTVQALINPENIVVSGLLLKPFEADVTITIVPVVTVGKLDFTVSDITLGNLSLPPSLADKLLRQSLAPSLAALTEQVRGVGEIHSIALAAGKLTVTGVLIEQ